MRTICLLALLSSVSAVGRAAERPLEALIDERIDAKLRDDGVTPAGQADDATLVRRLTLDLVGRVPTRGEVAAYLASGEPDKRARLVDRLIASPGFARYQAVLFDVMLSDRPGQASSKGGKAGSLRDYLTLAMQENRPWDAVFRDLMLPTEGDPRTKGSAEYLRTKLTDLDKLTADVSAAFFGVNVSCAQCHDHPNVPGWTQEHFYGMKAFLARTYDAGGFVAERGAGLVKYKPTRGAERAARLMFLTGTAVTTDTARELNKVEQKADKEAAEQAKQKKTAPPAPAYSARADLVRVALGESDFFARSIANRLWHRFLGTGLVNPLDQMHEENEPSHPELLDALADRVRAAKYDLRVLTRGIVMSRTYSRASRSDGGTPAPDAFAVGRLKPLTPQQLATSLRIATTDPRAFDGLKPDEFEKRVEQAEQSARGFASLLAQPGPDGFQVGVGEALLFSNGDRVAKEFLADGGGSLIARARAEADPAAASGLMVQAVFGRAITDAEARAFAGYLAARADRPADAYRQLLWALVTSPEFRFNH
jgi:hypothetical protein